MASAAAQQRALDTFPDCKPDAQYLDSVCAILKNYGFSKDNSIALIATCRDEITHHYYRKIDEVCHHSLPTSPANELLRTIACPCSPMYGESFDMSALAGLVTCRPVGLKAGMSHAPDKGGAEKYIFFAFPHIGIDKNGKPESIGSIDRIGRTEASHACGALLAVHKLIEDNGSLSGAVLDPGELEFSFLKQRLGAHIQSSSQAPSSLADLTKLTMEVTLKELESCIERAPPADGADYAVITGVQIHAGADSFDGEKGFEDYIFPGNMYVVLNNKRTEIKI
eukprot:SM000183S03972  [mRNA]  locus=s183:26829:29016:- [translate_table: standard]